MGGSLLGCFKDGGCFLVVGELGRGARGGGLFIVNKGGAVTVPLFKDASSGLSLGMEP